jgi:hypothetical protein
MRTAIAVTSLIPMGLFLVGCEGATLSSGPDAGADASPANPAPDAPATPDEGFESGDPASGPDGPSAPDGGPSGSFPLDTGIDGTGPLPAAQYSMTATLTPVLVDGGWSPAPPKSHGFSLLVDWSGNTATTGANRKAQRISLRRTGESEWESTEPLSFILGWWGNDPRLAYSSLKLVRGKDGCTATAAGIFQQSQGDVIYSTGVSATMVGVPDTTGPQLSVVPSGEVHPLALTGIVADELLPTGTTAALDAAGTSLALVSAMSSGAPGISAFSLPDKALAFGATYSLRVEPDAVDLVGNKTAALPSFATLPDPGLFAQDGFEGPIQAYMTGFAAIASGAAPPIPAGATAVAVPPVDSITKCPARFTARLAVPTGAANVRFAFMVYRSKSGWGYPSLLYHCAVAVPTGAAVATWDSQLTTTPLPKPWTGDPPGSDLYTYGDLLEAEMPLPPGAGNEVMFDVVRTCAEPGGPPPGIIIDSLRVE